MSYAGPVPAFTDRSANFPPPPDRERFQFVSSTATIFAMHRLLAAVGCTRRADRRAVRPFRHGTSVGWQSAIINGTTFIFRRFEPLSHLPATFMVVPFFATNMKSLNICPQPSAFLVGSSCTQVHGFAAQHINEMSRNVINNKLLIPEPWPLLIRYVT